MAPGTRRRHQKEADEVRAGEKRKRVEEDDDESIDSDEAEGMEMSSGDEQEIIEEDKQLEDENETAEEMRLRLARGFLRDLGVDDEAEVVIDSDAEDSDGDDDINAKLRKSALRETNRITTLMADDIASSLSKASVTVRHGHYLPATCISLAASEESIAVSGGKDSRVIVWDVATATRKHTFKASDEWKYKKNPSKATGHIGNILSIAVSDDGQIAASGGLDGLVRVWDLRTPKLVVSLRGHRAAVQGLAFRRGARQLFSASSDRTVKIWDLNEMAYVDTLFGHGAQVMGIDCLHKEFPVSCGQDGTLRRFKVVEGSQLVYRSRLTTSIDCISLVNHQRFISGGDDGTISLWHLNSKTPRATIRNAHGTGTSADTWISSIKSVAYSDLAISGSGDGKLRFWKCEEQPKPDLSSCGELDIGAGFVNGIDVNSRGSLLVAAIGSEHRLGRWTRVRKSKNGIRIIRMGDTN